MQPIPRDSFNDAELTQMAMQIMKDLHMKSKLDTCDAEMTELAMEILADLSSTNPNFDPNDSYMDKLDGDNDIDLFDHDIDISTSMEETVISIPSSHSHSSHISYTNDTSDTNALLSDTVPSTENTDHNMVYLAYPSMSPQIVSENKLVQNDSFLNEGIAIPSIPTPNNNQNKYKFPGNKKRAVNGWIKYQSFKKERINNLNTVNSMQTMDSGGKLPYIRPPTLFIDKCTTLSQSVSAEFNIEALSPQSMSSDISSCISPRAQTPQTRFSNIPDFSQSNIVKTRSNPKKIKSKKYGKRKQKIAKRHPLRKVVSPIFVDSKKSAFKGNETAKKHSASTTPTVKNSKYKLKQRVRQRKRGKSIACDGPNNEYAIVTDNGFIFKSC